MTGKGKSNIEYLTLSDFQEIISKLRSIKDDYSEDIPGYQTRYPGVLEGIIGQLKQEVFGKELYPGVINKAAILFYLLTKNHPFVNGNKRIAVLALYLFLKKNVSGIYIDERTFNVGFFNMAIKTTESNSQDFQKVIRYLKRKIKGYTL